MTFREKDVHACNQLGGLVKIRLVSFVSSKRKVLRKREEAENIHSVPVIPCTHVFSFFPRSLSFKENERALSADLGVCRSVPMS